MDRKKNTKKKTSLWDNLNTNNERYIEMINCLTLIYNYSFFERVRGVLQPNLLNLKLSLKIHNQFIPCQIETESSLVSKGIFLLNLYIQINYMCC